MNFSFSSHVILHAGLARSCRIHISKSKEKPSPLGRRFPAGLMRGGFDHSLPSTTVFDSPPFPRGRGFI